MQEPTYSLIEIIRTPPCWLYETIELTEQGRCYLYRYDPLEQVFSRATVAAGAAVPHFRPLRGHDKLPLGGWVAVEKRSFPKQRLRLVEPAKSASA